MDDDNLVKFLIIYAILVLAYFAYSNNNTNKPYDEFTDYDNKYLEYLTRLNDDPIHDVPNAPTTTEYPREQDYYKGATRLMPDDEKKRECAIYYNRDVDLCRKYERWFNLPRDSLLSKVRDPKLSGREREAAKAILKELGTTRMPNWNVCRINFGSDGWYEPVKTVDGQNTIPYKNVANTEVISNYGDTLNWGYCYKQAPNGDVANVFTGVADNKGFIASDKPAFPFQNENAPYAELKFSALGFDDYGKQRDVSKERYASHIGKSYCNMKRRTPQGLDGDLLKCVLSNKNTLQDISFVRLNKSTLQFDKVPIETGMIRTLYDIKWSSDAHALMLIPKRMGVNITIIYYDACGRVDTHDTIAEMLSLKEIANIDPVVLQHSSMNETDGEYADVVKRSNTLYQRLVPAPMRAIIDQMSTLRKNVRHEPGLLLNEYVFKRGQEMLNVSNEQSMSMVQQNMTKISKHVPPVVGNPGFPAKAANETSTTSSTNGFWEWKGYIKTPVANLATYTFMMRTNASTQVDVRIGKELVLSRYSGATEVVSRAVPVQGNTFIPITVRALVREGQAQPANVNLYWDDAGRASQFVYIPSSAYYHDHNNILLNKAESALDAYKKKRAAVSQYIDAVDAEATRLINATFEKALQQRAPFLGDKFDAKYLSGVNVQLPMEKNVFLRIL